MFSWLGFVGAGCAPLDGNPVDDEKIRVDAGGNGRGACSVRIVAQRLVVSGTVAGDRLTLRLQAGNST